MAFPPLAKSLRTGRDRPESLPRWTCFGWGRGVNQRPAIRRPRGGRACGQSRIRCHEDARRPRPLAGLIGYNRLQKPVAVVERHVKGALFDCRMCGQCALSHTGQNGR